MSSTSTFDRMRKGVRAADRARERRNRLQELRELEEESIRDREYDRMPEFGYDHWESENARGHGARDHNFHGSSTWDFEREVGYGGPKSTMERERDRAEEMRIGLGHGSGDGGSRHRSSGKQDWEAKMEARIAKKYGDHRNDHYNEHGEYLGNWSDSHDRQSDHKGPKMEKIHSGLYTEFPTSTRQDLYSPGREDQAAYYPREHVPASTLATFGSYSTSSSKSWSQTGSQASDVTEQQPYYGRTTSQHSDSRSPMSTKSTKHSASRRHISHGKSGAAKNCVEINIKVPQIVQMEEKKSKSRHRRRPHHEDREDESIFGRFKGTGRADHGRREEDVKKYDDFDENFRGDRGSSQSSTLAGNLEHHSSMGETTKSSAKTFYTDSQDHPSSMETTRGSLAPVLSERAPARLAPVLPEMTPAQYRQQARNHHRYGRFMGYGQSGDAGGERLRGYPSPAYYEHRERIRAANYTKALEWFAGR